LADAGDALIAAEGLTLAIADRVLIADLEIAVRPGARCGLTGRSGLGKTVFVDAVVRSAIGETSPEVRSGRLVVAAGPIGYAPQRLGMPCWFRVGALLSRLIARAPAGRRADLREMADRLGLTPLAASHPRTLSGGEMQRLSLAVALCFTGDLLILDEPLTALDLATKTELLADVRSFLERYGIALLVVSHDLDVLISLAQDVHVLGQTGIAATVKVMEDADDDVAAAKSDCRAELLAILRRQSPELGESAPTRQREG